MKPPRLLLRVVAVAGSGTLLAAAACSSSASIAGGSVGNPDAGRPDASNPHDASVGNAADGGAQAEIIVTGVAPDSIVTDGTNLYWRASGLNDAGTSFTVGVGKCPLGGGCPAGGTSLATTSANLVFNDGVATVALAGGKVIVPLDGTLMACATGGCGGTLSTITSVTGVITSLTAVGTTLYFGVTGAAGSRFVESCDMASCTTPHVIGATAGAPGDPSVSGTTLAFSAKGIWVAPTTAFPAAGATLLANTNGIPVGLWNDGTDVYFGIGGSFTTDDAGNSTIQNDSGYVARCAVGGCGGSPTTVVSGESNVGGPVVSGTEVYWPVGGPVDANGNPTAPGSIQRCSTTDACATVTTLVSGGNPSTIAVDANYVYWGDPYAKTISRFPRHPS
jgi:hypothetical protein